MSKRAEQKAQEYEKSLDYYHYTSDNPSVAYQKGYEQAEKDLALTGDDIKFIIDKYSELPIQYSPRLFEEILKQFNEQRYES